MILRDASATNEGYGVFAELTGEGREGEPRIIDEGKASGVAGTHLRRLAPTAAARRFNPHALSAFQPNASLFGNCLLGAISPDD